MVGDITAAAAGDENLRAERPRAIKSEHACARAASMNRCKKACGAGADNDHITCLALVDAHFGACAPLGVVGSVGESLIEVAISIDFSDTNATLTSLTPSPIFTSLPTSR